MCLDICRNCFDPIIMWKHDIIKLNICDDCEVEMPGMARSHSLVISICPRSRQKDLVLPKRSGRARGLLQPVFLPWLQALELSQPGNVRVNLSRSGMQLPKPIMGTYLTLLLSLFAPLWYHLLKVVVWLHIGIISDTVTPRYTGS